MAAPASKLGWVVHFALVVRFTPLSPSSKFVRTLSVVSVADMSMDPKVGSMIPEDLLTNCSIGSMIQSDPIVQFGSRSWIPLDPSVIFGIGSWIPSDP